MSHIVQLASHRLEQFSFQLVISEINANEGQGLSDCSNEHSRRNVVAVKIRRGTWHPLGCKRYTRQFPVSTLFYSHQKMCPEGADRKAIKVADHGKGTHTPLLILSEELNQSHKIASGLTPFRRGVWGDRSEDVTGVVTDLDKVVD